MAGRKKPYTVIGLARCKCFRCGAKPSAQWQICADGNTYRPICTQCDIELNELVLRWAGDPAWRQKIASYRRREQ